ncbi:MAG: D-alanine--D-alanine ligase [Saprospiraceae bacterium]
MENNSLVIEKIRDKKTVVFFDKIKSSTFYIKLTNWEYWPMYVANFPLLMTWLWFALRARKLFFFSAVNPVIETGGMWGESKYNILKRIPASHLPKTIFVKKGQGFSWIKNKITELNLIYPIIAKPNIGERGTLVVKIKNEEALFNYFNKNKIDFIIQEFISFPVELAVMHHRMPGEKKGAVTSICIKETLKVIGDGQSTVRQLMEQKERAKLQIERFEIESPEILKIVPKPQETLELEPIGNHCRGTMFLNGNHHIDDQLTAAFNEVASQMDDIYYGRFDLKCASIEDLKNGKGFKIMEYNGIGAEPAHIYDPAYPFLKKYRDIFNHWKIIYKIYKIQKKKGVKAMSVKEAITRLKAYSNYQKSLNV